MQVTQFLQELKQLDPNQLAQKNGIGQVIIDSLTSFLESPRYGTLIKGFEQLEIQGTSLNLIQKQPNNSGGKIVVITGTMAIPRTQLKEQLEKIGLKVAGAVTKKTNYLLAGQNSGSKLKLATELGVTIIEMDTWLDFEKSFSDLD